MTVTLADLHWTAGVLDAKGSFVVVENSGYRRPCVRMAHKKGEVLERLYRLYGGTLYFSRTYAWCVIGSRAVAVALTLFSLMSEYRKREIEAMMKPWLESKPYRQSASESRWGYCYAK